MMQASMDMEVSVARTFIISHLYNKLPRRIVNFFGEELEKGLRQKFDGHWYPDNPAKGCGYRCIRASGEDIDPVMIYAAEQSRLDLAEVKQNLPQDLTVWIDPHEVSYRIGEKGEIKSLYSDRHNHHEAALDIVEPEIQSSNRGFNPDAQCFKPIDSLSSSLSSLSMSPSSPTPPGGISPTGLYQQQAPPTTLIPPTNFLSRHRKGPAFTTASFAATKFGSTKLKTHAKRPTHLSPTDVGGFVKQRGGGLYSPQGVAPTLSSPQGGFLMPQRPASVSPREAPQDVQDAHQQLIFMQQAFIQQQKQQLHQQHQQIHQQQYQQQIRQQQQLPTSPQHRQFTRSMSHNPSHSTTQNSNSLGLSSPVSSGQSMADMLSCNTSLGLDFMSTPSAPSPASQAAQNTFGNLLGGSLPGSSLPSPDGNKSMADMSMPFSIQHLIASN